MNDPFGPQHSRLVSILATVSLASLSFCQTPERIQVLGTAGSGSVDIWIDTSNRAAEPTVGANGATLYKGDGTMTIRLGNKKITDFAIPYKNLEVSGPPTALKATGGKYTFTSDQKINDLAGKNSGADLVLKTGSIIEGSVLNGKKFFKFSGAIDLKLLPKNAAGTKTTAGSIQRMEFDEQGNTLIEGQVHLQDVPLPFVTIVDAQVHFVIDHPASGPSADRFDCPTATLAVDLPDVISTDSHPLVLSVKNLSMDSDYQVTFSDGVYPAPGQASTTLKIPLAQPANFDLLVTKVTDMDVDHSKVTKLNLLAELNLPAKFKTATGQAVTVKGIDYKYKNDQTGTGMTMVIPSPAADLDIYWNNYRVSIPRAAAANTPWSNVVLDLDKTTATGVKIPGTASQQPATWTGFGIQNASLYLPPSFGTSSKIQIKDFVLDSTGLAGVVAVTDPGLLSALKVPGFASTVGKIQSLRCAFLQTHLTDFYAAGTLTLSEYGSDIGVSVALSDSGAASVTVDPTSDVEMKALGLIMSIDRGTVAISAAGKASVSITGSVSIPDDANGALSKLAGMNLTFADLQIDDLGSLKLNAVYLDVPTPVTIKAGPAAISVSHLGFGKDSDANGVANDPWVELSGDVSVSGLPTSGSIGFDGLRISKKPNATGVNVTFGAIHLDVAVQNVGRLTVDIEREDFPKANTVLPAVWQTWKAQHPGETIDVLRGEGSLFLECFGPSGGGIKLEFLASKHGWYGAMDFIFPQSIALGSTPFSLYGVKGGIGHNVIPDKDGATGVPNVDYKLVPMPPGSDANVWLFVAGVRIGTSDGITMWGDIVLSASFGNGFWIDLDGRLYFMEEGIGNPGPLANPSRTIHANLHYDGPTKTFKATAVADFFLPSRDNAILTIHGPMKILVSPALKEIRIGQDVISGSPPTFVDPVLIKFGPLTGQGVLVLSLTGQSLTFKTGASLSANFAFEETKVVKNLLYVSGSGNLGGYVYMDVIMNRPAGGNWALQSASGRFGINATITLTVRVPKVTTFNLGAGVNADLLASLDSNYKLSATGTATLWVTYGGKNYGFSPTFSYP
jgi:hypothetical protein